MGAVKEHRREVVESGSPLAHHSLNQRKIRSADQGQIRLTHTLGEEPVSSQPQEQKIWHGVVPLNEDFVSEMKPFIINLAVQREETETKLAIPARIINSAVDVNRIFVEAKKRGIETQMKERPTDPSQISFDLRSNDSRYPTLFPFQIFAAKFRQLPNSRYWGESERTVFTQLLPKAYIINLTSTDFTLEAPESIIERIETYGYTLASIATALPYFPIADAANTVFPIFLDISRRYIRRRP